MGGYNTIGGDRKCGKLESIYPLKKKKVAALSYEEVG